MRILFDTHAFIWWLDSPDKLSRTALQACAEAENELLLSVASVWELQIKVQAGKLKLSRSFPDAIKREQEENGLQLLPILYDHVLGIDSLPLHHRDPFDRLLISQSICEGAEFLSVDEEISKYPVSLLK